MALGTCQLVGVAGLQPPGGLSLMGTMEVSFMSFTLCITWRSRRV